MNENTVEISKDEYKQILELAYKALMLKEAVLESSTLDFCGKGLYFGASSEVAAIFKYAFPSEYYRRLHELKRNQTAKPSKEDGE